MNHTNYNRQLPQITLELICVKCDDAFTRTVPKLPGKSPTRGVCKRCQVANSKIAFALEGGNRRCSKPRPEGGMT